MKGSSISGFKLNNLDIQVFPSASNTTISSKGISVYGIHLEGCSNFILSRLQISTKNATNGTIGATGATGEGKSIVLREKEKASFVWI